MQLDKGRYQVLAYAKPEDQELRLSSGDETRSERGYIALNSRVPLVPPKPNEFDSVTVNLVSRAVFAQ